MPDIVTLHLILLVGIAVGVFFTLIFDSSVLEKRLHEEKKEQIRLESKVVVTKAQVRHLRDELANAKEWHKQAAHLLVEKERLEQKLAAAQSRLNQLDIQVEGTLQQLAEAQELSKQVAAVNEQNREARAKISKLNKKLRKAQKQVIFMRLNGKENLTLVRGIGPAYARRLQEGGIRTLSALALASPEQVCEIIQIKPWQNAAPKQWIAEARQLSAVFADEEE
jgi:predicted flap endonuclease-1-like 5' DNA nuclease